MKAALDGLVAVVVAAVHGWGVGFSALSVGVLQGSFLPALVIAPVLVAAFAT